MQVENKERWMKVCAQIAEEQDRNALIELVDELNYLLEEKAKNLGIVRHEAPECLQLSAAVH
jgi:hypothetical protein